MREVEAVETIFEDEGIEYNVQLERFRGGGILLDGLYDGLMFEVLQGQAEYCRRLLTTKGMRSGVVPAPGSSD